MDLTLKYLLHNRKLRERTIWFLLFSCIATSFPPGIASEPQDSEPSVLSRDNLPDMPPSEEIGWLYGVNDTDEKEPEKIPSLKGSVQITDGTVSPETAATKLGDMFGSGSSAALNNTGRVADVPTETNLDVPANTKREQLKPAAEDSQKGQGGRLPIAQESPGASEPIMSPEAASSRVEELTRRALLKIVELERFNLNYKLNAAKQGRWKGWRYAFFNEANNSLGLAGGIVSLHNRGTNLHSSSKVKLYPQLAANYVPMIGSIIGASAAALEFGINEYHEFEAFKKDFSPGKARKHVDSLKNELNQLLAERDALVQKTPDSPEHPCAKLDTLEGKVLVDLRDQALLEFQRYHLAARRLMAFQQSQYFFDLASNTTNAIGYEFAFLSLYRRRRVWNGRAGTMFDVSGALTMAGPILSRLVAKGVSEYHKRSIHETIAEAEAKECAILERDQKALADFCNSSKYDVNIAGRNFVERAANYSDQSKMFQDEVQGASKQLDKAKLVATQNVGAGLYKGGSKLASGILFQACGYPQLYNRSTQTATRVTNHLLFAAAVVGAPATAFAMADTLRIQVQGEINRHKLAAKGELPNQLIKKRLAQLDEMEAKLNAAKR